MQRCAVIARSLMRIRRLVPQMSTPEGLPTVILQLTHLIAAFAMIVMPAGADEGQVRVPTDTAGVVVAQRAWWQAFVLGDTAYLRAHSAPTLSLTLSSGRMFDRNAALVEAASHTTGGELTVRWANELVRYPSRAVAVVTSRVTETLGPSSSTYRYLTVLERGTTGWRVAAAQSTREVAFAARAYGGAAGDVADFVGAYRTPRGLTLRVVARDSALALIEPSGKELRIEPIGPGLFEFTALSPANGVVRLLFTRDATGRVTALSQLAPSGITAFPRTP